MSYPLPPPGNPQDDTSSDSEQPDYELVVRQQPKSGKVAIQKDKDRKPIDPPPIVQMKISPKIDPSRHSFYSPYIFMICCVLQDDENPRFVPNAVVGNHSSSLCRLKDIDNSDAAFFIFYDLSIKVEGEFRLHFSVYDLTKDGAVFLASTISDKFRVFTPRAYPGLEESTFMTRSFHEQGIKVRVRKDSRTVSTRKRNAAAAEFALRTSRFDTGRDNSGPQGANSSLGGYTSNSTHNHAELFSSPAYELDDPNPPNKRARIMPETQAQSFVGHPVQNLLHGGTGRVAIPHTGPHAEAAPVTTSAFPFQSAFIPQSPLSLSSSLGGTGTSIELAQAFTSSPSRQPLMSPYGSIHGSRPSPSGLAFHQEDFRANPHHQFTSLANFTPNSESAHSYPTPTGQPSASSTGTPDESVFVASSSVGNLSNNISYTTATSLVDPSLHGLHGQRLTLRTSGAPSDVGYQILDDPDLPPLDLMDQNSV